MPKKKKKPRKSFKDCRKKIKEIGITNECLSSRSGLAPYVNFLNGSGIALELQETLTYLRQSSKGIKLSDAFFQLLLFFADGSYRCLKGFDTLSDNEAWQKLHGCKKTLNTSQLKRLLQKITPKEINLLRPVIRQVFLSALKASNPDKVVLFLDSCVYDNDGSKCRGGVKSTYKNKKGYHPINLIWRGLYVDTVFQRGDYSTNHDSVAITMLQEIVPLIHEALGDKVQIIVRMDGGYYDQKIFAACDELSIKFVCAGKRYGDHQYLESKMLNDCDGIFKNNNSQWHFYRFQERRGTWPKKMQYRALFLRATEENGEALLGLDSRIILTNLNEEECTDEQIIKYDHSRGADELTHRAAKEFCNEKCLVWIIVRMRFGILLVSLHLISFRFSKETSHAFHFMPILTLSEENCLTLPGKLLGVETL